MTKLFCILLCFIVLMGCRERHSVVSLFPLKNYSQSIQQWIPSTETDYDQSLISSEVQQQRFANFYKHYYGASSPWNADHVKKILNEATPDDLKSTELSLFQFYDNRNKNDRKEIGFAENFRPYSSDWIQAIKDNIDLDQFHKPYSDANRGIAIDNLSVRALPSDDPFFYHYTIAGQGYPFDNLQISALWAGSPLYVIAETRDHAWSLILTADFIGWVKSIGIAKTNPHFIKTWVDAAFKQVAAITKTQTAIVDNNHIFHFTAYVGSVFPVSKHGSTYLKIFIPISDTTHHAIISETMISHQDAVIMPMAATPRNFSRIISTLLGRPYGWGNLYFYNDCSSELKNLFTPFGIWLPRHSSDQVYAGKMTDLSDEKTDQRIEYLMERGQRFTTLVYIDGHVLLYIGNFHNPNSAQHEWIPMTFQDMWGLRPQSAKRRAVIGKSVFFPLLNKFPEDPELVSQASKKHFQLSQLGETANLLQKIEVIDLHDLMYP